MATNKNDILHCFFTTGKYHCREIQMTLLPSMNTWFRSNFELYLYHLAGHNAKTLVVWMGALETAGRLTVTGQQLKNAQAKFLRQSNGITTRRLQQLLSIRK